MPRPKIDLPKKVKNLLGHLDPLPPEADVPSAHYKRSGTDLWNTLDYFERNLDQSNLYPAVVRRHLGRLNGMILVNLIEIFERFLKEVAAACVDSLAEYVLDDRFNAFRVQGSALAVHFGTASLGKSLCESATWLDCDEINDRFRRLLADPFEKGDFWLFPKQPAGELEKYETLSIVWQLRHSVVHNVGVVTQSDAIKLRLLARKDVSAPRLLAPTRDDLRYLKRFLDESMARCNQRIGDQLARLLGGIHQDNPILFDAQSMAHRISRIFGFSLIVAGAVGIP